MWIVELPLVEQDRGDTEDCRHTEMVSFMFLRSYKVTCDKRDIPPYLGI